MEGTVPRIEDGSYAAWYEELLQRLARHCRDLRRSLCAFWPVTGRTWEKRGLLVIGRAVNGWGRGELSFDAGAMEDPAKRREMVARAREYSERRGMAWVAEQEGMGGPYDTGRSPFWMAARGLVEALGHVRADAPWSAALAWTNLFKVAPMAGGNPTGPLRAQQVEPGAELLQREVEDRNPGAVVCLAGWGFSEPVLERLDVPWEAVPEEPFIQRTGTADGTMWVVTPHPQRRSSEGLVEAVVGVLDGGRPPERP